MCVGTLCNSVDEMVLTGVSGIIGANLSEPHTDVMYVCVHGSQISQHCSLRMIPYVHVLALTAYVVLKLAPPCPAFH